MLLSFSSQGPLRHLWHAVARVDDVQDKPLAVELLRDQLVLWRGPSGRVIAAVDRCSHRNSNLSPGGVVDGCLVCPHHGRVFGEGGLCVEIPRLDDGGEINDAAHLKTYACDERNGLVWVCLGTPRADIPAVPADDDPVYRRATASPATWSAPAPRVVEALLDRGGADGDDSGFGVPFTYRRSSPGGQLLVTCSPLGAGKSHVFCVAWTNDPAVSVEDLLATEVAALTELKPAVEAISGMFEIDKDAPGDGATSGAGGAWRQALVGAVTAQV